MGRRDPTTFSGARAKSRQLYLTAERFDDSALRRGSIIPVGMNIKTTSDVTSLKKIKPQLT